MWRTYVIGFIFNAKENVMADLKDKYGRIVYRMEGDRIIDIYGNWKYEIRGEYIFDTYGNRKFEIRGEWLYDTYGNRLGEMQNLVEYLDPPGDSSSSSSTPSYSDSTPSKRSKPSGCLGWLGAYIYLLTRNWGGRIGLILGVILTILFFVSGENDALNNIFIGILSMLLLGSIGAGIGGIVNLIRRASKKNK